MIHYKFSSTLFSIILSPHFRIIFLFVYIIFKILIKCFFSRKYERTKQVVDTLRRNEETLRGAVADYESKLQKQEQKFIEFQKHAEEKIQL